MPGCSVAFPGGGELPGAWQSPVAGAQQGSLQQEVINAAVLAGCHLSLQS